MTTAPDMPDPEVGRVMVWEGVGGRRHTTLRGDKCGKASISSLGFASALKHAGLRLAFSPKQAAHATLGWLAG